MGKIDYYTIHSWMREELHLEDTELHCYAVIHSLSQGDNWYNAGVKNIMEVLDKSEPTVINALKKLTEKKLIIKVPVLVNKIKRNYYKSTKTVDEDTLNDLSNPTLNDLSNPTLNDLSTYKLNNKEINNKEIKNKRLSNDNQKDELFEKFWSDYGRKGVKARALKEWNRLKDEEKQLVKNKFPEYLLYCKRSRREMKDASSYLHQEYYREDWNKIPDYYKVYDTDIDRIRRFKEYMVSKFPDLIYHHNPLTFEQGDRLMEEYGAAPFEEAMRRLCGRDIHQYYSIKVGVETILKEMQNDDV